MNETPQQEAVATAEPNEAAPQIKYGRKERRKMDRELRRENKAEGKKTGKPVTRSKQIRAHITNRNAVEFQQKNNKAWDEVNIASQKVWTLLSMTIGLSPVLRRAELTPYYPDVNYTGRLARTLVAEVTVLFKDFKKIRDSHAHREGRARDVEELLQAYEVYNNYVILCEKYNSCASHMFDAVSEQVGMAIEAYRAQAGEGPGKALADELRASVRSAILSVTKAKASVKDTPDTESPAQEQTTDAQENV